MGGSIGLAAFIHSLMYLKAGRSFSICVLYFASMGLVSLGLFLMTGFVGVSACLWFNKTVFTSLIASRSSPLYCAANQEIAQDTPANADGGRLFATERNIDCGSIHCFIIPDFLMGFALLLFFAHVLVNPFYSPSYYIEADDGKWSIPNNVFTFVLNKYEVWIRVIDSLIWAAIIALSVILKRRSAQPGGMIYLYNQSEVHKIMSERSRRLRDILKDPALLQDVKWRHGDLTSLFDLVAEWQSDGFKQRKDESVEIFSMTFVPWISNMNACLVFIITICTCYFCCWSVAGKL